jgi:hypothetical protein
MIFADSAYTSNADPKGLSNILHQEIAVVKSDPGGKKKERFILPAPGGLKSLPGNRLRLSRRHGSKRTLI